MTNDPEDRLRTAQEPGNPAADLDERHMDKAASSTGTQVRAAAPLIGSTWRRPSRPGPPDAARADLDLDPERSLPDHSDDLPSRQATTGGNRQCHPGDDTCLSLASAGARDFTA